MLFWIGVLIVFLVSLLVFRVFVRRDYQQFGSLSFFSTLLEFLIFGLHANLPYLYLRTPWPKFPPLPTSTLQLALGLVIGAFGLVATLASMRNLGFKTAIGDHPGQLHRSGPYRWSRNPQLLFYGILLLGFVILYPSSQALVWLVLYAAIAHIMVLTEEEHLGSIFKDEYQAYCQQIPRYLIFF